MNLNKPWWQLLAENRLSFRNPAYDGSQVGLNPMAARNAGPPMDQTAVERAIIGQAPRAEMPNLPAELYALPPQEAPQWPVTVPQELIRTGGAGGGFRDSNIEDATGLTGGGGLLTGGAGGGQRDSNIADATGTTGGNAGADIKGKEFDWKGLADGLSLLGKGMKGVQGGNSGPEMRPPALSDDSGSRMAAASQLWQAVRNKRKPKGLI